MGLLFQLNYQHVNINKNEMWLLIFFFSEVKYSGFPKKNPCLYNMRRQGFDRLSGLVLLQWCNYFENLRKIHS